MPEEGSCGEGTELHISMPDDGNGGELALQSPFPLVVEFPRPPCTAQHVSRCLSGLVSAAAVVWDRERGRLARRL